MINYSLLRRRSLWEIFIGQSSRKEASAEESLSTKFESLKQEQKYLEEENDKMIVDLRRSRLTMSSILVILAGTPASLAVEADAVAEMALVLCLWSGGAATCLSAGPPLCGGLCQSVLSCFELIGQGSSPHGPVGCQALPRFYVDVHSLHVGRHDITVPQLWSRGGSFSRRQLAIQEISGNAALWHVVDVA